VAEFEFLRAGNSEATEKKALNALFASTSGVLSGLVVTQTTTASGSVLIASGSALVHPSAVSSSLLGNDTSKTLDVFTANPMGGLPRNDIVAFDQITATILAIIGTPNATPTDPTVPATSVALARLRNLASATTIPTAQIDNLIVPTYLRGVPIPAGAWAAYAPTLTSSGTAPTLGTGNTVGNYTQTDKKVDGTAEVLWGVSPTAGTGFYVITVPVAANLHGMADLRVGTITLVKQSTGAQVNADLVMVNATQAKFTYSTGTGTAAIAVSGLTQPWVPANGDVYYAQFSYEAA